MQKRAAPVPDSSGARRRISMSYILDALKKAEKERQRNATKKLLSGSDTFTPEPHKRALWPYLLVIALLLNAGLFGWMLGPWNAKNPKHLSSPDLVAPSSPSAGMLKESLPGGPANDSHQSAAESGNPPRGGMKSVQPVLDSVTQAVEPPQDVEAKNEVTQRKPSQHAVPAMKKEAAPALPSVALRSPADDRIPSGQKNAAHGITGGGNKIYMMNELPQSVLSSLPDLSLSLHLYNADPSSRLINVKGKTLREGQELSAGLRLEEIRPDGAVFSFHNYRFEVSLNPK
jgi:general secretion pathway protein B